MSAVLQAPVLSGFTGGKRLLTAADLAAFPDELPTGPAKYELDDGRLVVMPPPGDQHGALTLKIGALLYNFGVLPGHGKARTEVAVLLRRNPDRVVGPDACFIANSSMPIKLSAEGYLETIPQIVVEVRSKNDALVELDRKSAEYLAAGVQLVWVIDPIKAQIIVYEAGETPKKLGALDELTANSIIPNFRVRVAEVFRD